MIGQLKAKQFGTTSVWGVLSEKVYVKDDYQGKYVDEINSGDSVQILQWKWWELFIQYQGKFGYIPQASVKKTPQVINAIEILEAKMRRERDEQLAKNESNQEIAKYQQRQQRKEEVKKRHPTWSTKIISDIVDGKIWIGMTPEMTKESWGNPDKVNRTVNTYGVKEQWVYGQDYLYFNSGLLETYQVSR